LTAATPDNQLSISGFKIVIIAGEASGDRHGARLVAEIQKMLPRAQFLGIGGEALAAQGVRRLARAEDLAVVGLTEVAGRLPAVVRALRAINRALRQERPALTILIDFPDFNFLVARLAKWRGVPVMYYISPQVWAWRRGRVRTIARYVDRLAVIFPFEEDFYRERGVPVTFVGHPLMETLPEAPDRNMLLQEWGLNPERLTLALLPGSRGSEIERHLPLMLKSRPAGARICSRDAIPSFPWPPPRPGVWWEGMVSKFLGGGPGNTVPCPPPKPPSQPRNSGAQASSLCTQARCLCSRKNEGGGEFEGKKPQARRLWPQDWQSPGPPLKIIPGQAYAALRAAHLAVVASGTVTVEAALAGTPTVIMYQLAPLTPASTGPGFRGPRLA
jgi:lipid A disaccharide synthetase